MTFSYGVTSYQRPYTRKLVFELQNELEALKCARVRLYEQRYIRSLCPQIPMHRPKRNNNIDNTTHTHAHMSNGIVKQAAKKK